MKIITELLGTLELQKSLLEQLLTVEKKKTDILQNGPIAALDAVIMEEQALVMQCSAVENRRMNLCEKLEVKTVSELIQKMPEYAEAIEPLYKSTLEIIANLKKISSLNMKILDTRLKLIKYMTNELGEQVNVQYKKQKKLNKD